MRKAFTLIELLVVVSIIALLIAILLPVLSAAKDSARATQCVSNLHQQGIATANFAVEHKSNLPKRNVPKGADPSDPNVGSHNVNTHWTTRMFLYGNTDPNVLDGVRHNTALLWFGGYFSTGQELYCPSQMSPGFAWSSYSTPEFPTPVGIVGSAIRVSYNHNPMHKSMTDNDRAYQRTSDRVAPANIMLSVDLISENEAQAPNSIAHKDAWNVLRGDGSAHFTRDPVVLKLRNDNGGAWSHGGSGTTTRDAYHEAFDRLMGGDGTVRKWYTN